ncbi:MAG: LuxR C-terminal-related transcriptional regulator [Bermanella sp.]
MFSVESSVVKTLAQNSVRVLAMKLQLPYLPLDMVKRNALMSAFEECADTGQVLLLEAASGYGKSTSLTQWLYQKKQQKEKVAWLTLDPKENDLKRFVTYLVCAVNAADPELVLAALNALDKDQNPQEVFHLFLNGIAQSSDVIYLALEGIHHLDQPPVLEMLEQLITQPPAQLRLYLTSCNKLPFPCARLESQGKLTVFCENELKFSHEETLQWLKKYCPESVANQVVDIVYQSSQGWINGMKLIQKLSPDFNHIDIQGDENILVNYFQQEWLGRLEEDELRICKQLTILGSANAEYLNDVFDQADSAEILTGLIHKHVFVVTERTQNSWATLHPLLQSVLYFSEDKAYINSVYSKACEWLHNNGKSILAVDMALKSQDKDQAARLLERSADSIMESLDLAQLLSWKQQLPTEIISKSPRLILIFSWTLVYSQQHDEAERLLVKMDQFFSVGKAQVSDELSGQLFSIRGYIARCRGNINNAIHLCEQALGKISIENFTARIGTFLNLSNAYMTQDNLTEARKYNRMAFEAARGAGSVHLEMIALHELARIEQVKCNLFLANKLVDEGLALSERLPNRESAMGYGRLLIYKGYLNWLVNRIPEAKQSLLQGLQVAQRSHDVYIIMGYVILSSIERHRNHVEKAYDYLYYAESKLQSWGVPGFVYQPWISVMRGNLLIDQGKLDEALVKFKKMYLLLDNNPYALFPEHYPALRGLLDVLYVRAKSIGGQHKEALKILEDKLTNGGKNLQGFSLIIGFIMRALLRFQLGNEDEALHDFRKAVDIAEKENCIMPFIEYSAGMTTIYQQLPNNLKEKPFVQSIMSHIDLSKDQGPNQGFAQVKTMVSQREMAVLKLIAQGLSNQAIAEHLFISLHTVKTHARRINAKLSVKSRTQAIIKAREVGLI